MKSFDIKATLAFVEDLLIRNHAAYSSHRKKALNGG